MALTDTDRRQFQLVGLVAVIAVLLASAVVVIARPPGRTLVAYFTSATAVFEDNSVRVLGVDVGTIDRVVPEGTRVRVEMTIDDPDLVLPADARAVVISPSLVTGRYVQLTPTYSGGPELADGAVIPVERTAVPLDVDDLARTAVDLTDALGPNGVNRDGSLSRVLDVGADNLGGNGQALNDTITDLGELSGTLADSREELFGTVTELQRFVSVIAANDAEVREFNTRLEDVSAFLADERGDLGAALQELSIALGEVAVFVRDNREIVASNVDRLTDVTAVLVDQQRALAETLDTAPTALGNLANAYNGSSGTLDTRLNINELTLPPLALICELLERGTPEALADLPITIGTACEQLGPLDQLPLPSAAEVITSLQAGQLPPVPGLALPTAPAVPAAPLPNAAAPLEGE
ncbi:MCE family protein [Pseudonocardia sp. KRD-184]|uniref:MCE family protein n=1 Tax=Pseudonocardia oceani TaxID=2792013 RepID=A0ABS6U7W1_9PSEU|nr:MCE family protein [Pseudonocardia oceani]MBW0090841.1 MCE family protein [Pseudonocardia oceani]MBW0094571.1 MCE family protein [Pseudonocardia oceani]MBW0107368.1 MCE family protein [Pseudonocardia oceani]MBW0120532.1 MCE family protein [Pseudonocardia oceani]MBW0128009.1 MCE family protein [Pseudonocardia oceani]